MTKVFVGGVGRVGNPPLHLAFFVRIGSDCEVEAVLDARQKYLDGGSSLADLYDPLYMPGDLLKAHQALDRAVDRCYRSKKFESERERVEFLFGLYEKLTTPLAITESPKKKRRRRSPVGSKKKE